MTQTKGSAAGPGGYLAEEIERDLRKGIATGTYALGEKLPTENALGEQYGVSRTVVREAIAGLRAAGLVISRRGSGVFVAGKGEDEDRSPALFGDEAPQRASEVIDDLELRSSVEIEAARLAAQRASNSQIEMIHDLHLRFAGKIARGEELETEDFAFHQGIAQATNNPSFVRFLQQLGRRTIPRNNLAIQRESEAYRAYMTQLELEHEAIVHAIEGRDPDGAAKAMKAHLHGSLERYRHLARRGGKI